jgi:hypothetical protein
MNKTGSPELLEQKNRFMDSASSAMLTLKTSPMSSFPAPKTELLALACLGYNNPTFNLMMYT